MKGRAGLMTHLFSDNRMISDLRKMLEEEFLKSDDERDYNTICELTSAIVDISDDEVPQPDTDTILKRAFGSKKKNTAETMEKDTAPNVQLFSDEQMITDLRKMLDEELMKPEEERDYGTIRELTGAIVDISDEDIPKPDMEAIFRKTSENKQSSFASAKKTAAGLITHLFSDNRMISDLRKMLDEEFIKSDEERDYNTICELTAAIVDISDDEVPQPETDTIIEKASEKKRSGITIVRKMAAGLSACFIAAIGANCYTLITHGENLWDTILKKSKGGYTIDLGAQPGAVPYEYSLPEPGEDPAQSSEYVVNCMLDLCGEYDVEPFVPSELPPEIAYNGVFEMTESHYECMAESDDFYFTFENGNTQKFTISLEKYPTPEDMPEILIPSDSYDVRDEEVNGTHIFVFPLNNRATAVFVHDDICYTINGYNIPTDAIFKLASGFVPASLINER